MATTVLAIRPGPSGSEIVFDHDGVEITLRRRGWFDGDTSRPELRSWAIPILDGIAAAKAAEIADAAADDAEVTRPGLISWIRDNRTREDVRPLMRRIAAIRRERP